MAVDRRCQKLMIFIFSILIKNFNMSLLHFRGVNKFLHTISPGENAGYTEITWLRTSISAYKEPQATSIKPKVPKKRKTFTGTQEG